MIELDWDRDKYKVYIAGETNVKSYKLRST